MSYEATGPKGSLIRIEVPGGDLMNAKIINTASGEELDNVAAFRIEGDVNENYGQAVVWLKLVNVDFAIDAYLKDVELLTHAFKQQYDTPPDEFEVNGRKHLAFGHLNETERAALIDAIAEQNRKKEAYKIRNDQLTPPTSDDPIFKKMMDDRCGCSRCQKGKTDDND